MAWKGRLSRREGEAAALPDPTRDPDRYWSEVLVPQIQASKEERLRLLAGREAFVEAVANVLFHDDPIGLNFETNTDEYESEAETITLRLGEAAMIDDLTRIVYEEFVRWFGANIAGPASRYEVIARKIWALRQAAGEV